MMIEFGKIKRMNKRGEESSSTGSIIKAVIAAFVLVIVLVAIYLAFTGKGMAFFKFLPGFNDTKPGVISSEIFGYSFADNMVFYYDGNAWNDFAGKTIEVNDKKIEYQTMKSNFLSSLYNLWDSKSFSLTTIKLYNYPPDGLPSPFKDNYIRPFVYGLIFSSFNSGKDYYWCLLKLDNSFECEASKPTWVSEVTLNNFKNQMKTEAIKWKSELLSKPMKVTYYDKELKMEKSIYVCTRILASQGKYYLVADLSNDVGQTGVCSIN